MTSDMRLMLIDGNALVHRAYHALPPLSTSAGEPTNATFGFASMLLKAIETIQPTHIIMAMDRPVPTFRHQAYAEYKAQRPSTPSDLTVQFRRVREIARTMNIPIYERDGFEADDLLGTLAGQAERRSVPTVIVTGDLDALQLVSDTVHVLTVKRGVADTVTYDPAAVRERYGLDPDQLPDYKGLVGDTSDNIPGVPGIGQKTATKLLAEYHDLEGMYAHLDQLPARQRASLEGNREQAFKSRELGRIVCDVPVALDLDHSAFRDLRRGDLIDLLRELEFRTLIERVQEMVPRHDVVPTPNGPVQQLSIFGDEGQAELVAAAPSGGIPETLTRVVRTADDLRDMISAVEVAGHMAFDTETTSTDPLQARLVGMSVATETGKAWYVPVGHAEGEQLPLPDVLQELRPLLESETIGKTGHNLKYDYAVMVRHGVAPRGLAFDTMLAAYLVNPTARSLSLSALAMSRLGVEMTPITDLIGKGKGQITMDLVDIDTVARYAGADADITLQLRHLLETELDNLELEPLFQDIEMPLVTVLADMELTGVSLDNSVLADMSRQMTEELGRLEGRIYEIAGYRFNINSTQQLGQLLFKELKLPTGRRTKTGFSTDSEVLERLRGRHEIVDMILDYRQLIKLKNTYVDALPTLVSPVDGRIHTDFNQTSTATGRLSSSSPNLQNIPIRGEIGRKIRRAFVPSAPGRSLLAADYSQIELRILAAMSGDQRLVEAFTNREDVHRATAAAVFGVAPEDVTDDQRRIAKVVNFGIIYGIGENRLAAETGISRSEAGEFIAAYNETYAGVKSFMDSMRKRAALYGWVSTLLNRRRPTPDIHSRNPGVQQAAERAAINMPIQGTAADIIKIAMIRLHRELAERYPEAKMLLQVHDELVFDVPDSDVEPVATLVREVMVNALRLDVPLEVEVKAGPNWYAMQPVAEEIVVAATQ